MTMESILPASLGSHDPIVSMRLRSLAAVALALAPALTAPIMVNAAPTSPVGRWFTEDRGGVVNIAPCGDALCGVIIGLSSFPPDGIKRDFRGGTQCHYTLLNGLKLEDDGRWHGSITNPEDGRTYDALVWVPADGDMRLRGYIGLALFGSTQRWPPFAGSILQNCHFH